MSDARYNSLDLSRGLELDGGLGSGRDAAERMVDPFEGPLDSGATLAFDAAFEAACTEAPWLRRGISRSSYDVRVSFFRWLLEQEALIRDNLSFPLAELDEREPCADALERVQRWRAEAPRTGPQQVEFGRRGRSRAGSVGRGGTRVVPQRRGRA